MGGWRNNRVTISDDNVHSSIPCDPQASHEFLTIRCVWLERCRQPRAMQRGSRQPGSMQVPCRWFWPSLPISRALSKPVTSFSEPRQVTNGGNHKRHLASSFWFNKSFVCEIGPGCGEAKGRRSPANRCCCSPEVFWRKSRPPAAVG